MRGAIHNSTSQTVPLLVTTKVAASLLSISERKLWELKKSDTIPCVRIGKSVRFDVRDLDAFIARQKGGDHAKA